MGIAVSHALLKAHTVKGWMGMNTLHIVRRCLWTNEQFSQINRRRLCCFAVLTGLVLRHTRPSARGRFMADSLHGLVRQVIVTIGFITITSH